MTDSMKFGPEWLRNLSAEGNTGSSSGGGNRYQLAEYRYGREEMLALFEQSQKLRPPASMTGFKGLYVEQAQPPLALAPMTEDENRLWTGRGAPPGAPRGRGGSMDRGRGRGRAGSFHTGFSRSSSTYDDPIRPFDRNQSDRGWSERNGDLSDWGVGASPRKEYGSSRGGSNSSDNWRRHRLDDGDTDGWRTTSHRGGGLQEKWTGTRSTSGNWREGDTRDEHGHLSDRQATSRVTWHSSGDINRGTTTRKPWETEDHLPEWATENPSESGGTFDASGAFHGSDEETQSDKNKKPLSKDNSILQKSSSQQNITTSKKQTPLSTSQSATNLIKEVDEPAKDNKKVTREEKPPSVKENKSSEETQKQTEIKKVSSPPPVQSTDKEKKKVERDSDAARKDLSVNANGVNSPQVNKMDDEFNYMKKVTADIVAKLILDDEVPTTAPPPTTEQQQRPSVSGPSITQLPFPAGLARVLGSTATPTMPLPTINGQDKWYYRDPQGEMQGPFTTQEMSEWYRAGYFSGSLLVRRECDERFFTLGDLVTQYPKQCPFSSCRLPPLKSDPVSMPKVPEIPDPLQIQQMYMQRLLQRHADAIRTLSQTEPWGALSNLQQRELVTQHVMSQPQVLSDIPFVPPIPNANPQMMNPLMHMINQMQQANKLPTQPSVVDKPPNNINTPHLDPLQQLIQQMGGLQSNVGPTMPQMNPPPPKIPVPVNPTGLDSSQLQQEEPIKRLLRQLATKQPQPDLWDIRSNQAPYSTQPPPQQWLGSAPIVSNNVPPVMPHSMWDLHSQPSTPIVPPSIATPTTLGLTQQPPLTTHHSSPPNMTDEQLEHEKDKKKKVEIEKEQKQRERKEALEREKKRKEQEHLEKLRAQKEAEEKRKEEQRRKEAEKKAEAERIRKEEEKIRKELEKARRESEEKQLREQEEKRKLKEQRKAEEEAKKKAEDERRREEEEKARREAEKKEQVRRQTEALRKMQEQQQQRTKVAPWCQTANASSTSLTTNLSLAEIQRAEKEKRAEQAALLQQQKTLAATKELQEQQVCAEKTTMQLKWATKKTTAPKKIKSLAEIQAEEQEKISKQAAEMRLAQQLKEKDSALLPVVKTNPSIWSSASQCLTWNTNAHTAGFWDDSLPIQKSPVKLTAGITKSSSTSVINATTNNNKSVSKSNKSKAKKEEQQVMKIFDKNGPNNDEFTHWCTKTLATLNSDVDIPTFVSFLRDIESPFEVKDYVRQYLGDNANALHFANQFVEKRSKVKDQQRAAMQHKDDLCQPAPAITPSTEFQEVKGKGKKTKKSKMMKMDSRCLGFSVTSSEDRINVGDRDYGDSV